MVRPGRDKIGSVWPIELDVVFVGGKTKSRVQGKTDQVPVIIAVEIRRQETRDYTTNKVLTHALAGRIRLQKIPNKTASAVNNFARDCIASGAIIMSDDGKEFTNLLELGPQANVPCLDIPSMIPPLETSPSNPLCWQDRASSYQKILGLLGASVNCIAQ